MQLDEVPKGKAGGEIPSDLRKGPTAPPLIEEWDARTELEVGIFIRRYVADHPAPEGKRHSIDWLDWSKRLERSAHQRLTAVGGNPLRPVGGGVSAA